MRFRTVSLFGCITLAGAMACEPVFSFTGTEGASFLELPVGARPAAMGSAYSMLAEDAYAPTWNPAGLAFINDNEVAGMHMLYLESSSYEYGSFVHPMAGGRGIGVAIQYFRPGSIAGLDANGMPIGDFNGSYANYSIAFGQSFGETFGFGISGNLVRAQIDNTSGHAFAGGAGVLYRPDAQWRLGAVVANAGQKLTLLNSADSLPLVYRVGGAFHPHHSWTLALEGAKQIDGLWSAHTGVEYETPFGFSFRMGYNSERTRELSQVAGLSFGASMLIYGQDFAYTWLPLGDLGSSHLLSLVWHFGHKVREDSDTKQLQRPSKEDDVNGNMNLDEYR